MKARRQARGRTALKRRPRRIRKNPAGQVVCVWIWPDGGIAEIPKGKNHFTAFPEQIRPKVAYLSPAWRRAYVRSAGKGGYFRGAVINRRLYVERAGGRGPSAKQMRKIRDYARAEGLSRGVIIERIPERLNV